MEYKKKKQKIESMYNKISLFFIFLLLFILLNGAGWKDYQLDIGDGYRIVYLNNLQVGILHIEKGEILYPSIFDDVGPLAYYYTSEKYIFSRNLGRKNRDLFDGDRREIIDINKEFYFVIKKIDGSVLGPLTEKGFISEVERIGVKNFRWKPTKNPNFFIPLIGFIISTLFFIFVFVPIKYYYVFIPISLILLIRIIININTRKL